MCTYTLRCTFLPVNARSSKIQFHSYICNFPTSPHHDKIASFFVPTPQILKQLKEKKHLNKPKPLILVCCSDGEILQVHTKLDVYFIFSASKCQGNLHVSYFACVLRVASTEKTAVVSLFLSLSPPLSLLLAQSV